MASATRPLGTQRAGHLPINTNNPRPGAPPKARAFLPAQEGPACLPSRAPRRCPPRRPAPATAQPPGDAPETRRRRTPRHPGARSRTCQSPAIRGPGVGGRAARTPPRAPLRVRRRPRAHRVPRRPRAQSPRERRVRTRASESGLRRARRRGCPPRPGPSEEAAPSAPRRSPHLSPEPTRASAARGAAPSLRPPLPGHKSGSAAGEARLTCSTGRRGPSRTIGPPLRRARHSPGLPVPPGAAAAAAMSSRSPSPRPRCQVTPSNLGPGAARAAPRLRLDPSRRRLRRLRSARLARGPRTAPRQRRTAAWRISPAPAPPRSPSRRAGMRESL